MDFTHVTSMVLGSGAWDGLTFLKNLVDGILMYGGYAVAVIGAALVVAGAIFFGMWWLASNSPQGAQGKTWWKPLIMIIVGGAFLRSQLELIMNLADGGTKTIKDLGGGVMMLLPYIS